MQWIQREYNIHGVKTISNGTATIECNLNGHDPISLISMVLLLLKETEYIENALIMGDNAGLDIWLFLKQRLDGEIRERAMKKIGNIKQYIKLLGLDMGYSLKNSPVRHGLRTQEPYFYFGFYVANEE